MVQLELNIVPFPAARPRLTRSGHAYTCPRYRQRLNDLETSIREVIDGEPDDRPLKLELTFRMPMPKSWSQKKHIKLKGTPHDIKPDLDNLIKSVLDVGNGLLWKDDRQISSIKARKRWSFFPGISINMLAENICNVKGEENTWSENVNLTQ